MSRRITTDDFIKRAKAVHGDRYDYSDTRYINAKTKLTIRCQSHGPWSQLPGNHLAGKGCRACTGLVRLSTAEFIRRSQEVHGTKYDYSKTNYVNQKTRVRIICPTHGEFLQLPAEHYHSGSGCNRCAAVERGLDRRLTAEEFIERAKAAHGDQYDYSHVKYRRNSDVVVIVCPKHGEFRQAPKDHFRGNGCPSCSAGGTPLTTKQFIEKARRVHGDRYGYSQTEYVRYKTAVKITCRDHGAFSQRPVDHLLGHGCQQCAAILRGKKKRLKRQEFVGRSEAIHGDQYDYSLVEYRDIATKVTIICPIHGPFRQSPSGHMNGRGCAECGRQKLSDTTESFVEKARNTHGDRYDYSLVEYVSQNTKVKIVCPEHGPFLQAPGNHINQGSGCADCSGKVQLTTEKFIKRAREIHGERYDYSRVDYRSNKDNVTIVCPEHGPFEQTPTNHYQGKGCPDCGGSKQHTTQSFIEAAQAIHGDRYDYSQVEYRNNKEQVKIICRDHGPFSQLAAAHLRGSGCSECAGRKPGTTDSFVEKAQTVHGDRFDYSQVDYKNAVTRVTIVCPDHGPFSQAPSNHLAGSSCPDCGHLARSDARRSTTEQFITKAIEVHSDRYDYSLVEYVGNAEKVTIICSDHGPFEQTPAEHLVGSGCAECGRLAGADARRRTTEQFIANAKQVHGDRYDYSLVEYLAATDKVAIICPDHGPFEQAPNGHLGGKGCYECGKLASAEAKRTSTEEFISKARTVHGKRYDYSLVEYVGSAQKVSINCPDHGCFFQAPADHINQRSGCPDCAETGFNPSEPGLLYYLAITTDDGDTRYKIGITNTSVDCRFRGTDLARIRIIKTWRFAVGRVAAEREAEILYQYAGDRYYGPDILLGGGNTELFTHDVLGLDD